MEYQRSTVLSLQKTFGLLMLMLLHGAPTTQGDMTTLPAKTMPKVVTSPLEPSHASSPLEATHASSPLEPTHASSPLQPTHASSPLEATHASSPLQPTHASSPLQPTHASSPLQPTHASSPLQPTHASSPLQPTHASSPLELNPPRVVVRYGDSVSVNCSTSSTDLDGMGWEATLGGVSFKPDVNIVTWTVDSLTDWTIEPTCYKSLTNGEQKEAVLAVILYKTPDSVSISPLSHSGPMVEGTEYQLQCDIQNVAPLRNLVVKWYKGDEPLDIVTYSSVSKTPEDVSATLMITPSRDDDGAQYRCVAELDLGPDGPQHHPTVTSEHLNITVHYKPVIECPSQYSGVEDSTLDMIPCTFYGNPPPNAVWYKKGRPVNAFAPLARTDSGQYVIITTNDIGSTNSTVHITVELVTSPLEPSHASSPLEATHASSPLELNPPRVVVRYGDSVSVNCSTSFTDLEGMGWEATLGGIPFKQDVNIVTWTVDSLTDWTIKTTCYKSLTNGEQKLRVLPVILYKTPDSVSISPLSHSGPMVEGTEYQLQCDIQNVAPLRNLVVKWYKGDEPLDIVTYSNVSKTPEDVSATLMITPSRDDDGAQYRCVAELDLGPDGPQHHPTVTSEHLNITVHYKPVIECPSQYSGVEDSTLDMIPCTFYGNPPPNAVWYKKGRPVNAFAPLARTDSGQYVIITTNDIGSTNSTVHITVEYAPKFTCPERYEIKENENHNLPVNCTVDGNPSPKITWLKTGKEVDIPQSLTRENSGEYTVVTNNKHGHVSHVLVIDVLYAPEFLLGNDTVKVSGGSDVSLNCSAEGNPPPQIKWNYTAADNVMLSTVERRRTVSITRATSTNAGIYVCTATNIVGTATRTITVTMKDYSVLIILVIILVVILLIVLFLIAYCMLRKRKGHYSFIPNNTSDKVPMMPLSTTGVGNPGP